MYDARERPKSVARLADNPAFWNRTAGLVLRTA